jgi:hypothetical protein
MPKKNMCSFLRNTASRTHKRIEHFNTAYRVFASNPSDPDDHAITADAWLLFTPDAHVSSATGATRNNFVVELYRLLNDLRQQAGINQLITYLQNALARVIEYTATYVLSPRRSDSTHNKLLILKDELLNSYTSEMGQFRHHVRCRTRAANLFSEHKALYLSDLATPANVAYAISRSLEIHSEMSNLNALYADLRKVQWGIVTLEKKYAAMINPPHTDHEYTQLSHPQ